MPGIDYSGFAGTERLRAQMSQRRLEGRLADARQLAKSFAARLRTEFGATEVILFGSVLHPQRFSHRSDIDLAVRGIAPEHFLRAYGLGMDSPIPIDLVDLDGEVLRPEIVQSILGEGEPLGW